MGASHLSFLGLIPARYASTRFPGKPLADIAGKTMIQRVYEQASLVLFPVVATDDERIETEVMRFGGRSVMTSGLHQSGTDRCAEALDKVEALLGRKFDVVVNIQGDEPFIRPEQLRQLMDCFDEESTQIATLVKQIADWEQVFNPNRVKAVGDVHGRALYFSRAPIPFARNIPQEQWCTKHRYLGHLGLYAYRSDVLRRLTQLPSSSLETTESLEQNRWLEHGFVIRLAETEFESYSVDTPDDLDKVRHLFVQDAEKNSLRN